MEQGWLHCAAARQRVAEGDVAAAHALFTQATEIAERFGSPDLIAIARHGQGRTLLGLNRIGKESPSSTRSWLPSRRRVAPIVAGAVYCSVISACHDLFDLRRAQEWTTALQALVRRASRPGALSWAVPDPPIRAAAAARRVARRLRRSATRLRPVDQVVAAPAGGGRGLLPARRTASAARRLRQGRRGVPSGEPGRPQPISRPGAASAEPGTAGRG